VVGGRGQWKWLESGQGNGMRLGMGIGKRRGREHRMIEGRGHGSI